LRLRLPDAGGGRVVACGAAPGLGSWNPAAAPALERAARDGEWVLRHMPDGVAPGSPFKYVIQAGDSFRWEDSRGNRSWPARPRAEQPPVHCFDRASPRKAAAGAELVIEWGEAGTPGGAAWNLGGASPSAIFHAFHWQFAEVARRAGEIAGMGFDAVQLSPAQRSVPGDQWWTRYQPVRYEEIHGLGGEHELREACKACARAGLWVLGDVVFNHMQVVASCEEWRRAQHDHGLLEHLKGRLDQAFAPAFNRDDFQWPWFELQGSEWDGPMRMEGWGCGEWSELRAGTPKVVARHKVHLEKLRGCGVDGFRFDAAKHMRPEHIALYASMAYSLPPVPGRGDISKGNGTFVFGEVLSVEPKMHAEYQHARPPASETPVPDGPYSTTDFLLGVWLRRFLEGGEACVDFPLEGWVRHLLEVEQGHRGSRPPPRCTDGPCQRLTVPLLARNSVRFARNHDTVCNDVPFYGLGGWSGDLAATATAWLLAVHDGAVIVLADDARASSLVRQALLYRRALREGLAALGDAAAGARTEVRATRAEGGGPPLAVCIACRLGGRDGACLGFCVLGVGPRHGAPVEFRGSSALAGAAGSEPLAFLPGDGSTGPGVTIDAEGQLAAALLVESGCGAFFVAVG